MAKYKLMSNSPLVVWHEDSLKTFTSGQIIEAKEAPHEWFELVEAPKKETPVPTVKKAPKPPLKKKVTAPKIDLPTQKF